MSTATDAGTPDALVDRVAAAALSVPGVDGLHAGSFGEVGTYLPGRRVAGIRLADDVTEIHVAVVMGSPIPDLSAAVVSAVSPLVDTPVQVYDEDVVPARTDEG